MKANWNSDDPILKGSVTEALAITYRKWWEHFKAAYHKIETKNKVFPAILRDRALLKEADSRTSYNANLELIEVLKNHAIYSDRKWPADSEILNFLTPYSIDGAMRKLKRIDRSTTKWLSERSGGYHPLIWIYIDKEDPDSVGEDLSDITVRDDRTPKFLREYPGDRAVNELAWCLCSEHKVSFRVSTSSFYTAQNWADWIAAAEIGTPPFWKAPNLSSIPRERLKGRQCG